MAEQTFKSPGFFEREIEIISRPEPQKRKVSAALIGPTERGPAFVPTYVSSYTEYVRLFGNPDRNRLVGHAASEYFKNNEDGALTICRVLGGGSNVETPSTFGSTGTVKGAGFEVSGSIIESGELSSKMTGSIHFIAAQHTLSAEEHITLGMFNDNDSFSTDMDDDDDLNNSLGGGFSQDNKVELVRAMIVTRKNVTVKIHKNTVPANVDYDTDLTEVDSDKTFIVQFNSQDDSTAKSYKVSLNPESSNYIENVLNTDPLQMDTKWHYLYAHFPVDTAVADVPDGSAVGVLTGDTTRHNEYGKFNTRYQAPKTTKFISQPFGTKEYDLFHFEALDDGAYASGKYKISISDLKASDDPNDRFGTFSVLIRDLKDTDEAPVIYESYNNCSLDTRSENYIGRVIGDKKVFLNLDVSSDEEKRLSVDGIFDNRSNRVRVVVSEDVENGEIPDTALPFGFRGIPALRTTTLGNDKITIDNPTFLSMSLTTSETTNGVALTGSLLPPLPYRFKVTKGLMDELDGNWNQKYLGDASGRETVGTNLYWGVMSNRVSNSKNPNSKGDGPIFNKILENYSKFLGNEKSSIFHTGSAADSFNNHKFSLAQVVFSGSDISPLTGSTISDAFKNVVFVRNGGVGGDLWDPANQLINLQSGTDAFSQEDKRLSFSKILSENIRLFNKFSPMAKFTNIMYGGFDGVNIFDKDSFYMTDRASSIEESTTADPIAGKASSEGFPSGLAGTDKAGSIMQGTLLDNNIVNSYRNAIRVMTEEMFVNHNMLCIPGIRDSLVTDFAKRRIEDYGLSFLVMDIPHYDQFNNRLFTDAGGENSGVPDSDITSAKFDNREINSSYVATYFPDVFIDDAGDDENAATVSRRRLKVPSSVAAFGALALSSRRPWFAPAGFERGALDRVRATEVRLNSSDRDILYESRVNPIASFPNNQFVIFGQKTTLIARTALDRVNIRRLMINIKRKISIIAQGLLFAQNDQVTRTRFIDAASRELTSIQINQGIEDFRVIMDSTNNSAEDVDNNILNGKIVIVPTRAVEFIAIDFIITNSGVEFPS